MGPRKSTCAKVQEWLGRPALNLVGLTSNFALKALGWLPEGRLAQVAVLALTSYGTMPAVKKAMKFVGGYLPIGTAKEELKELGAEAAGATISIGVSALIQTGIELGKKADPTGGFLVVGTGVVLGTTAQNTVDTMWNRKRTVAGADNTPLLNPGTAKNTAGSDAGQVSVTMKTPGQG